MKWKRARGISCGKFDKKSGNKGGGASGSNFGMNGDEDYEDEDDFDEDDDEEDDEEFDMEGAETNEVGNNKNPTEESNIEKFKLEFISKQNFKISS